jgi:flagellar hook-associated protein 2
MNTGIDTKSIISQLMAVERIPQTRLRERVSQLQRAQAAWSQIGDKLTALKTAADKLAPLGGAQKLVTVTSSSDAVVARAVGTPPSGTRAEIEVVNLAAAHAVRTTDTFASADASAGGRTLAVTIGGTTHTFASGDGTIGGLVDAVNAAKIGVSAKIVQTSAGVHELVLSADTTGAAHAFTASGAGWAGAFATTRAGVDATLTVDGITIQRASNTFSDVIDGVELTLRAPTTGPASVTVERDAERLVESVKGMVDAANAALGYIANVTRSATDAAARGVLAGDTQARTAADGIRTAIAGGITGADGVTRSAALLGISLTRTGTITFDEAKLRESLAADPAAVLAALGRSGGSSSPALRVVSATSGAATGTRIVDVTATASRAAIAGLPFPPPPPGTIVSIDVTTSSGSLNAAFVTGSSVVETVSNLNAALRVAGSKQIATTDGSTIDLSAQSYGTNHTFSITGGAVLGLSGSSTAGADASAVVNATAHAGIGRNVNANGLVIEVSGPVTGATVTLADGLAGALSRLATATSGSTDVVTAARAGLDSRIADLNRRIDRYDDTLARREELLIRRFTAMDQLVSQLSSQTTALSNLAAPNGS